MSRAIVKNINGDNNFKLLLLEQGIITGTVVDFNYSPQYSKLTNITVNNRMISLRSSALELIEFEWEK